MRLPGNEYRTSTQAISTPKNRLMQAAANAAPKLNLYDATTRGSVTVAQKSVQPMDVVLIKIMDSGKQNEQTDIQHRESE